MAAAFANTAGGRHASDLVTRPARAGDMARIRRRCVSGGDYAGTASCPTRSDTRDTPIRSM